MLQGMSRADLANAPEGTHRRMLYRYYADGAQGARCPESTSIDDQEYAFFNEGTGRLHQRVDVPIRSAKATLSRPAETNRLRQPSPDHPGKKSHIDLTKHRVMAHLLDLIWPAAAKSNTKIPVQFKVAKYPAHWPGRTNDFKVSTTNASLLIVGSKKTLTQVHYCLASFQTAVCTEHIVDVSGGARIKLRASTAVKFAAFSFGKETASLKTRVPSGDSPRPERFYDSRRLYQQPV